MNPSRLTSKLITITLSLLLLAGCASAAQPLATPTAQPTVAPTPGLPSGPGAQWHVVVIGDSSMWGLAEALASQIEEDIGVTAVAEDFALSSLSAGEVLDFLKTGKSPNFQLEKLPTAIRDAEVVVMFVNPMFSINPEKPLDMEGCFGRTAPQNCSPDTLQKYVTDLQEIWARIFELRAGQPTILRAADLYSPLVSNWNEAGTFEACTQCWKNLSNAARAAADTYSIPFVSRYDDFNGADHTQDPRQKGFILSDGEHPTDLAAQHEAELISKLGYEPVPAP